MNIQYLRKVAGIRHCTIHILLYAFLLGAIAELRLSAGLSVSIGRITQIRRIGILHGGLIGASGATEVREAAGYAEQVTQYNSG